MKVASYEDAWLRENDQAHRPGWNSTFFFTVRIDLFLQLHLQVLTVYLNLIAPVATNRSPVEHEGGLV